MHDLEVARVVQESLFPGDGLEVENYGIYGTSRAMTDIGGDYFDYRVVGERHLIGLVGDVAGHGVPAALIMGMAKSAFSLLAGPDRPLEQFMTAFNDLLVAQGTRRKHMMTIFCFILDLETGVLTVLNGGHNFPLLFRAATGRAEEVVLVGHPLGVRRKVRAERGELDLKPGDALILYTDGVIESRNGADAVVGYERAAAWVAEAAGRPERTARDVVVELFRQFDAFIGSRPAGDDVTLVCLKRRPLVSGGGNV